MEGPYYEGQRPQECGHYFPDVLRFLDIKREKVYYRVLGCVHCGRYTIELLDPSKELKARLDRNGVDIAVLVRDIPEVRKRELARLLQL